MGMRRLFAKCKKYNARMIAYDEYMSGIENLHGANKRGVAKMDKVIPKMVIIEVTNRCNLKCKYCPTVANPESAGDMSLEMFKSIADKIKEEMPTTTTVCAWMLGEPFLNPHYLDMCRYLSSLGISYYVTTNLTIWDEELIRFLLSDKSTCYQIIVSMDGLPGTKSISLARPGTDAAKLVSNVHRLLRIKGEMDSEKDIAVKICERGQDWQEIEEYVQYWLGDEGIDYVCIGKILAGDNPESMRVHPCQFFDRQFMAIRWNGELVLCDYNPHIVNDHALGYGKYHVGDSLLELYNTEYIQELRDRQRKGDFPWPCSTCSFAYTGHGFEGEIRFRDDKIGEPIYYHQDYYNLFFSLKKKWKPKNYYVDK